MVSRCENAKPRPGICHILKLLNGLQVMPTSPARPAKPAVGQVCPEI